MTRCKICREPVNEQDQESGNVAEMYDPDAEEHLIEMDLSHGIVHAECGLSMGWETA